MWKRGLWAAAVTTAVLAFGMAELLNSTDGRKLVQHAIGGAIFWVTPDDDADGKAGLQQGDITNL